MQEVESRSTELVSLGRDPLIPSGPDYDPFEVPDLLTEFKPVNSLGPITTAMLSELGGIVTDLSVSVPIFLLGLAILLVVCN
jgi:hypothetical protein